MPRRRLLFYLLLNILVSATVTGSILFAYDRYYRPDCAPTAVPTLPTVSISPVVGDVNMGIVSVIGAGEASSEIVVIQNKGVESVVLTGWYLQNGSGISYTFPEVKLNPQGTIQLHTIAGNDRLPDIYWGRTDPAWKSGDVISLFDAQGILRAVYLVP